MSVIIDELHVEIVPSPKGTETGPPRPTEAEDRDDWWDAMELARERAMRLACD